MRGPKNAWREREQKKKRIAKITTLKKYAKLAKKEGIVSDRVRLDSNKPDNEEASNGHRADSSSKNRPKPGNQSQQPPKLTPLQEQKASRDEFFAQKEAEKKAALKKRKDMHKIMTQRTSRGQPVMAGRIKNILGKLLDEAKGNQK